MANQVHKGDLIEHVHNETDADISKENVGKVVNTLIDVIGDILVETDAHVVLQKLGVFKTQHHESKMGQDFEGITIEIPAHKRVTFSTSRGLKERLKK